jgi:Flp pilus assembly protein protease CpaA
MERAMPAMPFYPDPLFGWIFYLTLAGLLAWAAYVDWRLLTIPKPIVFITLGLGLALNLARGLGLGRQGWPGTLLGWTGAFGGAADGLLFAVAGFAVGFLLFFALWLLGTCGGGDVKLFAALGAWLGPLWTIYILIGSYLIILFGFVLLGWLSHVARRGLKPRKQQIAYSFPVALAVLVILLWTCRAELGLWRALEGASGPVTVQIK